jgi:hypothetical protein
MVKMNEPKAFPFLFENLMLGGGVGFSVRREDVHELPRIKSGVEIIHDEREGKATNDADFIVPDSREGWVRLLEKTLDAFFVSGKGFSGSWGRDCYSRIRGDRFRTRDSHGWDRKDV